MTLLTAAAVASIAAYTDFRTGRIPNTLTFTALAAGVLEHTTTAFARGGAQALWPALGASVGGAMIAAIVPLVLYRAKALGGGDVKLFIALGALLGPLGGLEVQLLSFVFAAAIIPFRLAWEGRLLVVLGRTCNVFTNLFLPASRKRPLDEAAMTWFRLGPAILAGTLWEICSHGAAT